MASSVAFRVRLRLLPSDEGGRRTPIMGRLMALFDIGVSFKGMPVLTDGRLTLEDREVLHPGQEGVALLEPLSADLWTSVEPGQTFTMHEGRPVRGYCTVVERIGMLPGPEQH